MEAKKKHRLYLFLGGLVLLLTTRDVIGASINKYVYLLYIVGWFATASIEELVCMLAFCFPVLWGLPDTYVVIAAVVFIAIARGGRLSSKVVFVTVILALLEIIAYAFYPSKPGYTELVSYIAAILLFFLLLDIDLSTEVYEQATEMFFYGCAIICIIIIVSGIASAPSNWMSLFEKGWFRFGSTIESEGVSLKVNANNLGYYSALGIAAGLGIIDRVRGKTKALSIALFVGIAIAGILSVSRAWMLVTLLIVTIYLLSKLTSIRSILFSIAVIAIVVVAATYVSNRYPLILGGLVTRITRGDAVTANGRIDTFNVYSDAFFSNIRFMILGMGATKYSQYVSIGAIHNGTQQIIICYGLFGSITFLYAMLQPVFSLFRKRAGIIYWLILITTVMYTQTIQFIMPYKLMLPFVVGVYAIKSGIPNEGEG